jgi:hypothetical protein
MANMGGGNNHLLRGGARPLRGGLTRRCHSCMQLTLPNINKVRKPQRKLRFVRLAYQPPANSTFLLEQTSHQQSANSTFLFSLRTNQHQSSTTSQTKGEQVCMFFSTMLRPDPHQFITNRNCNSYRTMQTKTA